MDSNSELDTILVEIGEYGKYQRCITLLIMFVTMMSSVSVIVYVFEATLVNHRCKITECDFEHTNYNPNWLAHAVPFKNGKPSRCTKFVHTINSSCEAFTFNTSEEEKCNTFIYETTQNSIMQDFNLHCDENLKALTLVGTISGVGKFIGLPIAGFISDRYGRKNILICSMLLSGFFGLLRSFSTSYFFFVICEFLDSVFTTGIYSSGFVLGTEFVGPNKRALVSALQFLSFCLGSVVLGCAAWLIPSWRILLRALYPFYMVTLAYYWLLPESVRWLLTKNRRRETINILRNIAIVNKTIIGEGKLDRLLNTNTRTKTVIIPIKDLFKSRILLIRFFICSFCWISCISVFYGMIIISTTLSENGYLDFILTAAVEAPANVIFIYIANSKGRKTTLLIALVLSSVSSVSYMLMPVDIYWTKLCIYLIGKFGITISISTIYTITNEVFPTPLRQTMLSICSMFGRVGNILAPQLILLVEIWKHLPLIIFATVTAISSVLILFLPETNGLSLPDTIKEAENIGRTKPQMVTANKSDVL